MENKDSSERIFPPADCFYQDMATHANEQLWSLLNTSMPGRMVNKIPFCPDRVLQSLNRTERYTLFH